MRNAYRPTVVRPSDCSPPAAPITQYVALARRHRIKAHCPTRFEALKMVVAVSSFLPRCCASAQPPRDECQVGAPANHLVDVLDKKIYGLAEQGFLAKPNAGPIVTRGSLGFIHPTGPIWAERDAALSPTQNRRGSVRVARQRRLICNQVADRSVAVKRSMREAPAARNHFVLGRHVGSPARHRKRPRASGCH